VRIHRDNRPFAAGRQGQRAGGGAHLQGRSFDDEDGDAVDVFNSPWGAGGFGEAEGGSALEMRRARHAQTNARTKRRTICALR